MNSIKTRLKPVNFPAKNYFPTLQRKTQIVLHHTAGGSAMSAINWWKTRNDGKGTIATPYVIERDGTIYQLYNAFAWAHHLGVSGKPALDRLSIGIELVSWGAINEADINKKVPAAEVVDYVAATGVPFKGSRYFQNYTPAQLESLSLLLPRLSTFAGIPLIYNEKSLFSLSPDALAGVPGLYTHVSYRQDKSDCHPQPDLKEILIATCGGSK